MLADAAKRAALRNDKKVPVSARAQSRKLAQWSQPSTPRLNRGSRQRRAHRGLESTHRARARPRGGQTRLRKILRHVDRTASQKKAEKMTGGQCSLSAVAKVAAKCASADFCCPLWPVARRRLNRTASIALTVATCRTWIRQPLLERQCCEVCLNAGCWVTCDYAAALARRSKRSCTTRQTDDEAEWRVRSQSQEIVHSLADNVILCPQPSTSHTMPRPKAAKPAGGSDAVAAASQSKARRGGEVASSVSVQSTARLGLLSGLIEGTLAIMELLVGISFSRFVCVAIYQQLNSLESDQQVALSLSLTDDANTGRASLL